jgi:hypothetical protein
VPVCAALPAVSTIVSALLQLTVAVFDTRFGRFHRSVTALGWTLSDTAPGADMPEIDTLKHSDWGKVPAGHATGGETAADKGGGAGVMVKPALVS